jgi:hypothetical protein
MEFKNSKCLVLNADYTPLTIISWKKALVWSYKHEYDPNIGVEIIDFYKNDYILGANNKKHPIPAVVKTSKYFRVNNHKVKFSRKNLFIRDNHTCQYCGSKPDMNYLTYDHVIPKSLWSNDSQSPTTIVQFTNHATETDKILANRELSC